MVDALCMEQAYSGVTRASSKGIQIPCKSGGTVVVL